MFQGMADMGLGAESLSRRTVLLAPILGVVECVICLETVKIPFKQCMTGHLMCSSCMATLAACPHCQQTVFQENSTCIKQLLSAIPHVCRHSGNGCRAMVEPSDTHETYCPSRSVSCKEIGCRDKVPLNRLITHYQTKHVCRYMFKEPRGPITWYNRTYANDVRENLPILTSGHFFWLEKTCFNGTFEMSFNVYSLGEPTVDYFIRLKLENGKQGFTYMLKALNSNGEDKATCLMRIPKTSIEWLVNAEGHLVVHYEIYGEPKAM